MSIHENVTEIRAILPKGVTLVAVSKTQSENAIIEAYQTGQTIFGESRPQELVKKYEDLPKDISWHMIGHLQTNKVRMISPFVSMIESVDSQKLLNVINSEAIKCDRSIDILLEMRIAEEQTKSGWDINELRSFLSEIDWRELKGVFFRGVMGIATYTEDSSQIKREFDTLYGIYRELRDDYFGSDFDTISMGMSGDWELAIECGSNMVRLGSSIFGERNYKL